MLSGLAAPCMRSGSTGSQGIYGFYKRSGVVSGWCNGMELEGFFMVENRGWFEGED